ncbi:uncharacterized protein LOC133415803 isoform X10 [Phycodurus eques]|uniref:uncharacterized protein LOC133415803 isoform X10 n=1 Tax=Phycodurus eques TaxID=693459 RepID=UPI002ACE3BAB|nr:uncharacterized protein LOC133415803 isoform X10 [Phycodurus eques]
MSEEEKRPCESVPSCRAQRAAGEMRAELGRDGLPTSRLHASPRKERTDGQTASRSGHDRTKLSSLRVTDEDGVRFPFAGVAPPPASPSSPSPAAAPRVPLRPGRGGSDSSFPPARRTPVSQRSLDSPLGPASRPRSPRGCFDPYDSPELEASGGLRGAAVPSVLQGRERPRPREHPRQPRALLPLLHLASRTRTATSGRGVLASLARQSQRRSRVGQSRQPDAGRGVPEEEQGPRGAASLRDQHLPLRRPRLGRRRRRLREARPAAQGSRASRPNNARRVRRVTVAVQDSVPFAVIGSNVLAESRGRRVKGRTYPWGVAEVESAAHSDFLLLRDMLVRTHMRDLKDVTRESHYENYRARCIRNMTRMVARDPKRSLRAKCREESDADVPLPLAAFDADKDRLASEKDREIGGPATRTRVRRSRRVVAHLVPVVCAAQGDDAGGDAERPRVRPRQHRRGNNVPVSVGFLFAHASACPPCHFELHLFVIHCHCFYCHLVADDNQEQSNKNC